MEPIVKVQVHGHTATITLNRPDKRNALSRALMGELEQALSDLHQERRVRGVILIGAGKSFCAGMDLDEMLAARETDNPQQQWYDDSVAYHGIIEQMLRFPKTLIAAVNGPAVAGGAGLVMACDLVVACPSAAFGFPEPKRGVLAGMVAPLLNFRVGASHAAYLLFTARIVPAADAYRMGLFHEIVPDDMIWARANELVNEVALSAPESVQAGKKLLNETIGERLFTELVAGTAASAAARTTEAAAEGLAAFLEKRDPKWW